jgi:hypothetical protein
LPGTVLQFNRQLDTEDGVGQGAVVGNDHIHIESDATGIASTIAEEQVVLVKETLEVGLFPADFDEPESSVNIA